MIRASRVHDEARPETNVNRIDHPSGQIRRRTEHAGAHVGTADPRIELARPERAHIVDGNVHKAIHDRRAARNVVVTGLAGLDQPAREGLGSTEGQRLGRRIADRQNSPATGDIPSEGHVIQIRPQSVKRTQVEEDIAIEHKVVPHGAHRSRELFDHRRAFQSDRSGPEGRSIADHHSRSVDRGATGIEVGAAEDESVGAVHGQGELAHASILKHTSEGAIAHTQRPNDRVREIRTRRIGIQCQRIRADSRRSAFDRRQGRRGVQGVQGDAIAHQANGPRADRPEGQRGRERRTKSGRVAHYHDTCLHRRDSGVGVRAREDRRACAGLGEGPVATNHPAEGLRGRRVHQQFGPGADRDVSSIGAQKPKLARSIKAQGSRNGGISTDTDIAGKGVEGARETDGARDRQP